MPHDLFSNTVSGRKSGETSLVTSSISNTSQTTTGQDITNSIFNCLWLDDDVDVETNPVNQPSSLQNRLCSEIEEYKVTVLSEKDHIKQKLEDDK